MIRRLAPVLAAALLVSVGLVAQSATAAPQLSPEAALGGITQLDAGTEHTCARLTTGRVRCWGLGSFYRLGNGSTSPFNRPVEVLNVAGDGPLVGVAQVSAGGTHTCVRLSNSQVRCWGYNGDGALGAGDTALRLRAVAVSNPGGTGNLGNVRQVTSGRAHSCVVLANGQARCWGDNLSGQIGDGTSGGGTDRVRPVVVKDLDDDGPLTGVTQIEAGGDFTCARLNTGRVACWGQNGTGNLGDGSTDPHPVPALVDNAQNSGPLVGVVQVVTGEWHACARLNNGQARCWGQNFYGDLGNGPGPSWPRPLAVRRPGGAALTGITTLAAGDNHTCARLTNGQVQCWGRNDKGQLGDRTITNRPNPVAMRSVDGTVGLSGVATVAAGGDHTCVRLATGRALCVGSNVSGQLGDRTNENTSRPVGVRL